MNTHYRLLIILLCSPLIVFIIHAALVRLLRRTPAQAVAFRSLLLGYLPSAFFLWSYVLQDSVSVRDMLVTSLYGFIVYSTLAYTYFHFFNMSETARRIRILYEIYQAGALHVGTLMVLYKSTDIISLRLKRLLELGQLKYDNGYYSVQGKMLYWAGYIVLFWRRLLGFERDGAGI